jgi:hypothetical protein
MPDPETGQTPGTSQTPSGSTGKLVIEGLDPKIFAPGDKDSDKIKELKINSATDLYRWVIAFLGVIVLLVIAVSGIILGKNPSANIPDGIIAIGSAAVGAIAGMLAQSPSK